MSQLKEFRNPIIPGFAPDPSVVLVDGVFYLVTSSFHVFPGLPIYASRDLQNWDHIGNAINRPSQLSLANARTRAIALDTGNTMIATAGLFAATIRHHQGKFYIVCTNCLSSNGSTEGGATDTQNFIIQTSDIWSDHWSDPVPVEFAGIDPNLFFDDDGKVYFQGCYVINRSKQPSCTIKQFEVDVDTGKQLTEQREIWGGFAKYDTEGPHTYKKDGWYYLLVAEGGTFEHHLLSIARSKDIWGPYESYERNPIMTADGKNEYIQNIGHGELFEDVEGQWWAAVLGVRSDEGCAALGRESFLTPVEWPRDGWPRISQPQMRFQRSFTSPKSDGKLRASARVADVYIRDPVLSDYRYSTSDTGAVVLKPSREDLSTPLGTSTFVGLRQRSLHDAATARLLLTPSLTLSKGLRAGLALYRDHMRHVSIVYDSGRKAVVCRAVNSVTGLDRVSAVSLSVTEGAAAVSMKIESSPTRWTFFAKVEALGGPEESWTPVEVVKVKELDARDFTGPIYGVFAHSDGVENEGVEVEAARFRVNDV
ncbi:Non-reducing end alpha-L-arabinofuranosidase BoGH43A [Colletotrichum spinosum]|uniref:Non-reducing end alpha-L-arabinofuranosidase BoGH43A n=1 Tax=Colletotrichum spinosum TaxID=1347390 RepID=A0A4R8QF16_9PEZI|nr:Non-reducing end alpha-L-arabinofuranosidase BoGH43A [Colletotrichum spinosum]